MEGLSHLPTVTQHVNSWSVSHAWLDWLGAHVLKPIMELASLPPAWVFQGLTIPWAFVGSGGPRHWKWTMPAQL